MAMAIVAVTLLAPVARWPIMAQMVVYLVAGASGMIGRLPVVGQSVVYMVLGIIWILPLRRFLIWMETGRFG